MYDELVKKIRHCATDPMHDICPSNCYDDIDRPCKSCALDWLKEEANP